MAGVAQRAVHQLVHNDFRSANILHDGTRISAVLDFEEITYDTRVADIAKSAVLLATRYRDWGPTSECIRIAYVNAYDRHAVDALTPSERVETRRTHRYPSEDLRVGVGDFAPTRSANPRHRHWQSTSTRPARRIQSSCGSTGANTSSGSSASLPISDLDPGVRTEIRPCEFEHRSGRVDGNEPLDLGMVV